MLDEKGFQNLFLIRNFAVKKNITFEFVGLLVHIYKNAALNQAYQTGGHSACPMFSVYICFCVLVYPCSSPLMSAHVNNAKL